MSRVGKQPIPLPKDVNVSVNGDDISVESKGARLSFTARPEVTVRVDQDANEVVVERSGDDRVSKAMHGLTRALINNMIIGVTKGFEKDLEIVGVGWNAQLKGQQVALNVGFADTKMVPIPQGVKVEITQNRLKISGPDKQAVGQCAAQIRAVRKPEPYNGKGIKYAGERIIRKSGKAFGGGG